jgi:hypothetical protein
MAEWSKDHMADIGSLNLKLWSSWWIMDNLISDGTRRWKRDTVGWEGRGVVCGKSVPSRL